MENQPVVNNQLPQTPADHKYHSFLTNKLFLITLAIAILFTLAYAGIYLTLNSQLNQITKQNQTPQIIHPSPFPTTDPTANWKTYTNTIYGFSFSYPPNLTVPEVPDYCGGCIGSINIGNDIHNSLVFFSTMSKGAYCDEGGSSIDDFSSISEPMQIAEAEARCGCSSSGMNGNQACSKASNEKVLPASNNIPKGYQFYLQQDYYSIDAKLIKSGDAVGPYRAFFFLKPVTFQGTENIGVYFKLEKGEDIKTFDQILSTFKFTDQKDHVVCTQDAKQCPDGSYVSRQPPTCEFAKCP